MRSSDDDAVFKKQVNFSQQAPKSDLDLPELYRRSERREPQHEVGTPLARIAPRKVTVEAIALNAVFKMLHEPGIAVIVARAMLVELASDEQIYRTDDAIEHVYLPVDCVLSVVTTLRDGTQVEVGSCGREGVSAISLLLGATRSANDCYCQVPGTAIKVDVANFQSLKADPRFQARLDAYIEAYVRTIGQLAACNGLHTDCERLSRWLLTTQDRVGAPSIRLSPKTLETVLGVTSSAAKISVDALQNAGFISCADGLITVLDRPGLEGASCECYSVARKHFENVMRCANVRVASTPLSVN